MNMNWLLVFIPISFALDKLGADPTIVFLASAAAIVPLASLMEKATEVLAHYLGPTYGGMLSATMGNAPELIIGISALRNGLIEVLKGSIAGSVLGTLLFGMGMTIVAGGLKKPVQTFDQQMVSVNSSLLMLATFGLIIPAVFHFSGKSDQELSLEISVILLLAYLASMAYTLFSHRPTVGKPAVEMALKEKGEELEEMAAEEAALPHWTRNGALGILGAVTVGLAFVSELLTGSLEPTATRLGLTPAFAGVFLLALVGNLPQYMNSVSFASKNQMTLALSINLGATTQLALMVAPLLVIAGEVMGLPMNLLFSQFELIGIILSVVIAHSLISDHTSTWLEGVLLIAVYAMLGFGFFNMPAQ
ncbi:MAG: calcium/proton exchanger [Deltaproteobacteria bacterium]|nr:calcium/proton exchanger [Deltaproteobacteria bacterium]